MLNLAYLQYYIISIDLLVYNRMIEHMKGPKQKGAFSLEVEKWADWVGNVYLVTQTNTCYRYLDSYVLYVYFNRLVKSQ